jgi:phosphoglycerol transferase MdoB-like AlkP superfamily enzyme
VIKTIDLHDPGMYSGIPESALPPEIRYQSNFTLRSIYWDDFCLSKFFQQVKSAGLFTKDTLFVITADHAPNLRADLSQLVCPEHCDLLGKIPLIFVSADITPFSGLDRNRFACQFDLAPTLLNIMGVDQPQSFMGQSLFSGREGFALSYFTGKLQYRRKDINFSIMMSQQIDTSNLRQMSLKKWYNNYYTSTFNPSFH